MAKIMTVVEILIVLIAKITPVVERLIILMAKITPVVERLIVPYRWQKYRLWLKD
jgi:hypothetical protein